MKKFNFTLLYVFLLCFVVNSMYGQDQKSKFLINEKQVNISFTVDYTFNDLIEIKNKLQEQDIEIVYTSLEFTEQGYLKQISASIDYKDGQKASFTSRQLKPGDGPGFNHKLKSN